MRKQAERPDSRMDESNKPGRRIVSLLPSATEIVCALGLESDLVGRSHECDYPASVGRLPALTAPRFDPHGSSRQIDERVRDIVERALSVYLVDAVALRDLHPDFIVTQSQCEVCAVSEDDVVRAVADWTGARPAVISLGAMTLEDVWSDIERVATRLGVADRGVELSARLRQRVGAITAGAVDNSAPRSVTCLEWLDPLMGAGSWIPEMVAAAGGVNMMGAQGGHAPTITLADLAGADPEIIVAAPCGFSLDRSLEEIAPLFRNPAWRNLRAVRAGRVYAVDGNQYFNRPGPRIVESIEILAEILADKSQSGRTAYGHEGIGWRRVVDPLA
jgi:iron complex transport system substrate-binding protein